MSRLKIILSIAIIIAVTGMVFYPSLHNDFNNWDDDIYVWNNPKIKNLSWKSIQSIFTTLKYYANYIPLTLLSYMIEYHYFKLNAHAYHANNLLLHLINCILTFFFIYIISNRTSLAFIVALLFGIHPLHVESVAWVAERKDVLYSAFYLGALITYWYYLKKQCSLPYYLLSLFLFSLSLLSKPMAVSLPFILFLLDYKYGRIFKARIIFEKIPFFAGAFIIGLITLHAQRADVDANITVLFPKNLLLPCYGILFYLKKIFYPVQLSALYPYPENLNQTLIYYSAFFAFSVILFILILKYIKNRKDLLFGVLFFLITIAPVLQLLPIGNIIAADRYTYIPSIGIFYITARFVVYLYACIDNSTIKTLYRTTGILILFILCFLTWQRTQVWRNSITLWNDVLSKYPTVITAYNNRGVAYFFLRDYNKAIQDFYLALQYAPYNAGSYNNLCRTYLAKGEYDNALSSCQKALLFKPDFSVAYINLGDTYHRLGKYNEAILSYERAIKLDPLNEIPYNALCTLYRISEKYEAAIQACKQATELQPYSAEAYNNLGNAYLEAKKYSEAIAMYKKAISINPDISAPYNNLAVIYFYHKQYDLAVKYSEKALELGHRMHPDFIELIEKYKK